MARDDSWAQVLRVALPILDETRPSGMLGWVPRVAPVVTQAAVGAGHWAAERRRRALAAVVGMVIGVWWGMRWPRRLTVLAIAVEAPNAVSHVPWMARAVQRRRPGIAGGWALVVAGSVARLRAASAEPLR